MMYSGCPAGRARGFCKGVLVAGMGLIGQLLAPSSHAGLNSFTHVGPYGGVVYEVAFHPTDWTRAYAATTAGFYRSFDSGRHWQLSADTTNEPQDFVIHPSQPNKVFVLTPGMGVYSSDDGGATLTLLSTYPGGQAFASDIEYSADGSILYVASGLHVYRSTDDGASWQQGGDLDAVAAGIGKLAVDPTDPEMLYVTAADGSGYQSSDAGATWQPWSLPFAGVTDLAIANSTPLRIWAATVIGTYYSEDRGQTWVSSLSSGGWAVTVDPNNARVIYSGAYDGLHRSTDNGATWTNIATDSAQVGRIRSFAVAANDSNRVLLAGMAGIAASSDRGASWTSGNHGIEGLSSHELISMPGSDRMYVSTLYGGVFAITPANSGSTPLNNPQLRQLGGDMTIFSRGLTVQPGTPERLLTGVTSGIARSFDGGATWSLLVHPDFNNGSVIKIVPASSDGQRLLAQTRNRLLQTDDGGDNWDRVDSLDVTETHELVSAPSDPQVIYLTTSLPSSADDMLLRSTDGGISWTAHASPIPSTRSLAVDPSNAQTIFLGGQERLYKSTDGGANWTQLPIFPASGYVYFLINAIAIDPQNPRIVYAGGLSRIARSVDGGDSWQELTNEDTPSWNTDSLAVDANRPHSLYAASSSDGVREFSIQPDLRLTFVGPFRATAGVGTTYTYRIRNAGPLDATNVSTRLQLPTVAADVSATSTDGTCSVAANVVTCSTPIARLNTNIDIAVTATLPAAPFAIDVTVTGDQPDAAAGSNRLSSTIVLSDPLPQQPPPSGGDGGGGDSGSGSGGGGGSSSPWMLLALSLLGIAQRRQLHSMAAAPSRRRAA